MTIGVAARVADAHHAVGLAAVAPLLARELCARGRTALRPVPARSSDALLLALTVSNQSARAPQHPRHDLPRMATGWRRAGSHSRSRRACHRVLGSATPRLALRARSLPCRRVPNEALHRTSATDVEVIRVERLENASSDQH